MFRKAKELFYNSIDLEQYYRLIKSLHKYIRKLVLPSFILSSILIIIYVFVSNKLFHSYEISYSIIIFILSFAFFTIRGCLRGEDYKEEHTKDS